MIDTKLFFEAIALRKLLRATYNRMTVTLAPHILYTKHGELYLDAVTIDRDGQPPRERKLGAFKLTGLKDPLLLDRPFEPDPLFEPDAERYAGVTLFKVE